MANDSNNPKLYAALIGPKKQAFYLSYFQRAEERGYAPMSWNWPALFIPLFWFLYRKQYRWAVIVFVFPIAALVASGVAEGYAPGWGLPVFYTLGTGFLVIWLPLNANGIYYRWAQQQVQTARTLLPAQESEQVERLAQVGGVNANLPLIVFGAFTVLSMLMGSLQQGGA